MHMLMAGSQHQGMLCKLGQTPGANTQDHCHGDDQDTYWQRLREQARAERNGNTAAAVGSSLSSTVVQPHGSSVTQPPCTLEQAQAVSRAAAAAASAAASVGAVDEKPSLDSLVGSCRISHSCSTSLVQPLLLLLMCSMGVTATAAKECDAESTVAGNLNFLMEQTGARHMQGVCKGLIVDWVVGGLPFHGCQILLMQYSQSCEQQSQAI